MKKFVVEYAQSYNKPSDNYIGDYIDADSADEALEFAADWLVEHGMDEEDLEGLIPFVKEVEV